jgi:hypothetical protein
VTADPIAAIIEAALTAPTTLSRDRLDLLGDARALPALAAVLYSRPDLVDEPLLDRLADGLTARPQPREIVADVVRIAAYLASTPLAPWAWARLTGVLRDGVTRDETRQLLMPLVRDFVEWRQGGVGLDDVLALAESPSLAGHRALLLYHGVERFVFSAPESFTGEQLERMAVLFADAPRYPYVLASLAARRGVAAEVTAWIGPRLAGLFPFREAAAALLTGRPFTLLVAMNVRVPQGDEIIRLAPLLQALLDANPELTVRLVTARAYLYDHPRVFPVPIESDAAVRSALDEPLDGIVEMFEPAVPGLARRPELHDAIERRIAGAPPGVLVRADHGRGHFVFQTVALRGRDIARSRGLDRLGLPNVYETGLRLLAELGLPPRVAEERPLTPALLAGTRSIDAERVWSALVGRDGRAVALLNPFGGARPEKGFLEQHDGLLAAELGGLVAEGYRVVLLPNGTAWGGQPALARVLSRVDPAVKANVRVAPDPAEPGAATRLGLTERPTLAPADRIMRLFKYFACYADLVITIEGWMAHLAYGLGRPFRLFLAARSYSFDWHPHGRGRDQRLVTTLSARSRAAYADSGLLGASDPPPLPHRPRTMLLELALRGLGRPGGPESPTLLRRALRSRDEDLRAAAVSALGEIRPLDTVLADLFAALGDRRPMVARSAAEALLSRGADCTRELGAGYREQLRAYVDVASQRWASVQALGTAAFPALFRAAESHDEVIRREARWVAQRLLVLHREGGGHRA